MYLIGGLTAHAIIPYQESTPLFQFEGNPTDMNKIIIINCEPKNSDNSNSHCSSHSGLLTGG
jgi:hypothetical protein